MSLSRGNFNDWRPPQFRLKVLQTRDSILENEDNHQIWGDILSLAFILALNRRESAACQVLKAYFGLCPVELNEQNLVWSSSGAPVEDALPLGFLVHYSKIDLFEFPVELLIADILIDPRFDIERAEFFQLDNWTITEWIDRTDYPKREGYVTLDDNYDPHRWKQTDDQWTHAICARLLCHVRPGEVPNREAVEEAFEAVDKLFMHLPRRKNPDKHTEEWPQSDIFPVKIYFLLAVNLGKLEKARKIIEFATMPPEIRLHELLEIPAAYQIMLSPDVRPVTPSLAISEADVALAEDSIEKAVQGRLENGPREPLHGVQWPELLRRFSEAACQAWADEYEEIGVTIEQPSDVLLPPISEEALIETEARLGPLPPDLKEMVRIANGFKGAWHTAGGGFAGVDKLEAVNARDYELYLGIEPVAETFVETFTNPDGSTRTVTKHVVSIPNAGSGKDFGNVFAGWGAVENDDYEHVICPPETWKKMKDGDVADGEYRVIYYAHWTDGPDDGYRSMRHWIASMTAELERELASRDEV